MNIARLNFSPGDFRAHADRSARIHSAQQRTEKRIAILTDFPSPRMRIGSIDPAPVQLSPGGVFALTTVTVNDYCQRASVSFERLPEVVQLGDILFLNDGLV